MKFFNDLKNSIYGPNFYSDVIAKRFSSSFKYFLFFALLISILSTIAFSCSVLPKIAGFLGSIDEKILQRYPENLEIVIKGGQASTNVEEPYFVKTPKEFKNSSDVSIKNLENILVIDTKTDFSMTEFQNYKTMFLLTKNSVAYYQNSNGEIRINSLADFPDYTINKSAIALLINRVLPYLNIVYPVLVVFSLIGFFISIIFKMIYLFFLALLVWLVAKIKKMDIGYMKSYQMALHLITLPIIVVEALFALSLFVPMFHVPYIYTVLVVLLAIINLKPIQAVINQEQPVNPAQ